MASVTVSVRLSVVGAQVEDYSTDGLVSPVVPRARTVASTRGDTIWTVASGSLDEDLLVRMVISRPGR